MQRLLMTMLLVAMAAFGSLARQLVRHPDFNFPEKVIAEADTVLNNASAHTPVERIQAIMCYVNAKSSVNPIELFSMHNWIEAQIANEPDEAAQAVMRLYEAKMLYSIYSNRRYEFDQVAAPLDPLPESTSDWSGAQFRHQISELVGKAVNAMDNVGNRKLSDYWLIINAEDNTRHFYPYLRDFVYSVACEIVQDGEAATLRRRILDIAPEGTIEWCVWAVKNSTGRDLQQLYSRFPDGEVGGYILYHIDKMDGGESLVDAVRNYLDKQPYNYMTQFLKSKLAVLTAPFTHLETQSVNLLGEDVRIIVKSGYTQQTGFDLYRVTNREHYSTYSNEGAKLIQKVRRSHNPMVASSVDTIYVKVDCAGQYYVHPIVDGSSDRSDVGFLVTPMIPYIATKGRDVAFAMFDLATGRLIPGVDLSIQRRGNSGAFGTTDADGLLLRKSLPMNFDKFRWGSLLTASKDGKNYQFEQSLYLYGNNDDELNVGHTSFLISRPIYRPGDVVEWTAVAVNADEKPARNFELDVELRDANYEPVDTLTVVTDEYGRANGSFKIPTDRLTGEYSLSACPEGWHRGWQHFTVSDYKAPVIEIVDATVENCTTISGIVRTYTGMPVAAAHIKVSVSNVPQWWRRVGYESVNLTVEGTTDADGHFSVKIEESDLKFGRSYVASILATTVAAETASESVYFSYDKEISLGSKGLYEPINADDGKLPIFAITNSGKPTKISAMWSLHQSDKLVAEGSCEVDSTSVAIDLNRIDVGSYKLAIVPNDTTICSPDTFDITLYSIARNAVPASCPLIVTKNAVGKHIVGVPRHTELVKSLTNESGIVYVRRLQLEPGFTELVSDGFGSLVLATLVDGKFTTSTIHFPKPDSENVKIKVESWRNNLVPGKAESWKLTLSRADGSPVGGALVATMYDHALDRLAGMPGLTTQQLLPARYRRDSVPWISNIDSETAYTSRTRYPTFHTGLNIETPEFLYQPEFLQGRVHYKLMARNSSMIATDMAADAVAVEEAAMETEVLAESPVVLGYGSVKQAVPAAAAGAATEESFDFRTVGMRQAFWMPDLTFNADGSATINFTTPNAITTWAFRAWAWGESLRVADIAKNFVANKPVMVQPNLPRFLREGDNAKILATVYNNTDSVQIVTTTVETFDQIDGRTIAENRVTDTIQPRKSAIVSMSVVANVGSAAVGYRIKSATYEFADGQQDLIPILSSGALLVESQTFYLTSEHPEFITKLPKSKDASVSIQYCQNPVWDVVKALPGFYTEKTRSSLESAGVIFAAATARGLLDRFPQIKEALDIWALNPSDSALVSKLEKNEALKLALLQQTPWVMAAAGETERMQRLAATFDGKIIDKVFSQAVDRLNELQRADGGFAWGDWCDESSVWVTSMALSMIGHLNDFGFMPDNSRLSGTISRALAYLDKNTKHVEDMYAYVASLYPDRKPSTLAAQQAVGKVVQNLLKNRSKFSTAEKARAALILNANGNKAVARELVASLRQFEVASPQAGISFPSVQNIGSYATILEAFAKIDPVQSELDAMRQWLILQSQVTDDLGAWNPTTLITAILATGSVWTEISQTDAAVIVDGSPILPTQVEAVTGTFSTQVPQEMFGGKLRVALTADSPLAYGSVMSISKQPMTEVKALGSDEISITKRMLVKRGDEWVETTTPKLGEQVQVQMRLVTSRDLEYVTVIDCRPASFEPMPDEQTSGFYQSAGRFFYREMGDSETRMFISYLPSGTYYLSYNVTATIEGSFASGIATAQSQYAPEIVAHSGGTTLKVGE